MKSSILKDLLHTIHINILWIVWRTVYHPQVIYNKGSVLRSQQYHRCYMKFYEKVFLIHHTHIHPWRIKFIVRYMTRLVFKPKVSTGLFYKSLPGTGFTRIIIFTKTNIIETNRGLQSHFRFFLKSNHFKHQVINRIIWNFHPKMTTLLTINTIYLTYLIKFL